MDDIRLPKALGIVRKILPLISILLINSLLGKTSPGVYGYITSDTIWQDTVEVIGDVVVDKGATLIIRPGTIVRFADTSVWDDTGGNYKRCDFVIYGRLIGRGTSKDTIKFIPMNSAGRWGSVFFKQSEGDTLSYIEFKRTLGVYCGSIDAYRSSLYLKHSLLSDIVPEGYGNLLRAIGIKVKDCPLITIKNCEIQKVKGGSCVNTWEPCEGADGIGIYVINSILRIDSTIIRECSGGSGSGPEGGEGPPGDGIGILIEDTTGRIDSCRISNCDIYNNSTLNIRNTSEGILTATYNYWGTIEEAELRKSLQGNIIYSPWTDSSHNELFYSKYLSGVIEKDTTLSGEVILGGDVMVPEGVTLILKPKTKIIFKGSALDYKEGVKGRGDLIVYGKLKAIGGLPDSIEFIGDSTSFGSIRLIGDADDTLQYIKFSLLSHCIVCDSASPLIRNCRFKGIKEVGIECINNSSPEIEENTIEGCTGIETKYIDGKVGSSATGILCIHSSPKIYNNTITDCIGGYNESYTSHVPAGWADGIGILLSDFSSPTIIGNTITGCKGGNSYTPNPDLVYPGGMGAGIRCDSGSVPKIFLNTITQFYPGWGSGGYFEEVKALGIGVGILCEGDAMPKIGGMADKGNNIYIPHSILADTLLQGHVFNIINHTPKDIIATYNWWGTTDRDSISIFIFDHNDDPKYGYVIFEPFITDTTKPDTTPPDTSKPLPDSFTFYPLSPNPFINPCSISYSLPQPASVGIEIFDITGRKIWNIFEPNLEEGKHQTLWDGRDERGHELPKGIYFIRFKATSKLVEYSKTQKVILLR